MQAVYITTQSLLSEQNYEDYNFELFGGILTIKGGPKYLFYC